jgi:DNA replication licensing factor MCM4
LICTAQVSTQSAATDPRTGTIDMDMINTGRAALDREGVNQMAAELRTMLACMGATVSVGGL